MSFCVAGLRLAWLSEMVDTVTGKITSGLRFTMIYGDCIGLDPATWPNPQDVQ